MDDTLGFFVILIVMLLTVAVFVGVRMTYQKNKNQQKGKETQKPPIAVSSERAQVRIMPIYEEREIQKTAENRYTGKYGRVYDLISEELSSGAEGSIHGIIGEYALVAKLFSDPTGLDVMHKKLEWMVERNNQKISSCTAWPTDILFKAGEFQGYVMPKLSGGAILPVFLGPDYAHVGWKLRVLVALNLAIAVDNIHSAGYICGDLQSRNIYINTDNFNVTIMDTDSFHIQVPDTGKLFRCKVGNPEFLPPELLNRFLSGEGFDVMKEPTFTQETDLFALAIHLFMLLMDGYHPFASRLLPDNQIDSYVPRKYENIQAGKTYFFEKSNRFAPPVGAPSVDMLPEEIRRMFQWSFQDALERPSERITAKIWKEALFKMKDSFTKCSQGHYYFSGLEQCPWCNGVH